MYSFRFLKLGPLTALSLDQYLPARVLQHLVSHHQLRDTLFTHPCIERILIVYTFSAGHCTELGVQPGGREIQFLPSKDHGLGWCICGAMEGVADRPVVKCNMQ